MHGHWKLLVFTLHTCGGVPAGCATMTVTCQRHQSSGSPSPSLTRPTGATALGQSKQHHGREVYSCDTVLIWSTLYQCLIMHCTVLLDCWRHLSVWSSVQFHDYWYPWHNAAPTINCCICGALTFYQLGMLQGSMPEWALIAEYWEQYPYHTVRTELKSQLYYSVALQLTNTVAMFKFCLEAYL